MAVIFVGFAGSVDVEGVVSLVCLVGKLFSRRFWELESAEQLSFVLVLLQQYLVFLIVLVRHCNESWARTIPDQFV